MKKRTWAEIERWITLIVMFITLSSVIQRELKPPQDLKTQLNTATNNIAFNFVTWEIEALARKAAFALLSPQRFMDAEQRARFVLSYLDQVREAGQLSGDIDRAYTDPEIADPDAATQAQQATLAALRAAMHRSGLIAEAILGEQVSVVLDTGGFGLLEQMLPPVNGTFTPLPYILVISPRDHIDSIYQRSLITGLTAADQAGIEQRVEAQFPDYAAYVTGIGGLAAYPSMLLESSSIDWVSNVFAHEWSHHNMLASPVGYEYDRSGETRTINETAASLMGDWAGQEVVLRYYAPLLDREKRLPQPLTKTGKPPPTHRRASTSARKCTTRASPSMRCWPKARSRKPNGTWKHSAATSYRRATGCGG